MTLTTPKGKAIYPRLNEPDTKFNVDGVYSAKIHVSEGDYHAFKNALDKWFAGEYQRLCQENGNKKLRMALSSPLSITPEGDYQIYAKQVAKKQTKKGELTFTIALFDSKGAKITDGPSVGSGSILKLAVEPAAWYSPTVGAGYTLRLKAAQVIELCEFGGSSGGDNFGFSSEEEGYVSNGESFNSTFKDDTEENDSVPF
jgi:hypothetical protein